MTNHLDKTLAAMGTLSHVPPELVTQWCSKNKEVKTIKKEKIKMAQKIITEAMAEGGIIISDGIWLITGKEMNEAYAKDNDEGLTFDHRALYVESNSRVIGMLYPEDPEELLELCRLAQMQNSWEALLSGR